MIVPLTAFSVSFKSASLFEFVPGTFRYEGEVDDVEAGDTLVIQAAADEGVTLEILVDAMPKDTGDGSVEVSDIAAPLFGGTAVSIEIRAKKGAAVTFYTAEISPKQSEADNDSTLQSLVVSYNAASASRLSPAFSKEGLSYSMFAENGQNQGYVKAVSSSTHAALEIWYNDTLLSGSSSGDGTIERTFTLPGRNLNTDLLIKVKSRDEMSNTLYTVKVFGYQDQTITYHGQVSCSLSGYTIKGVTAISGTAGTQGAQVHFDSPVGNGYEWDLSAVETWVPTAFTVTLEKDVGGQKYAIESRTFIPASLSGSISLSITDPDQIGYRIFDANEFFSYLNTPAYKTENFTLAANIDLDDYREDGQPVTSWTGPSNYQGILYGNGYTINNLRFTTSGANTGLFNSVKDGAEIHDLIVNYQGTSDSPVMQSETTSRFGIIIGQMESAGTIRFVNVTVNGKLYVGSSTKASSQWLLVGGFIGEMNQGNVSTVIFENCVSNLDIDITQASGNTMQNIMCGSFIGRDMNGVELRNSYSTGAIKVFSWRHDANLYVGGLIGRMDKEGTASQTRIIENCYSASPIDVKRDGTLDNHMLVGGLVGTAWQASDIRIKNSAALNPSISALFSDGSVPAGGNYHIGRVVGYVAPSPVVTLADNVALGSMTLNGGLTTVSDGALDNKNGEAKSAANLAGASWWQNAPLSWPASVWNFNGVASGKWPTLK